MDVLVRNKRTGIVKPLSKRVWENPENAQVFGHLELVDPNGEPKKKSRKKKQVIEQIIESSEDEKPSE